MKKIIGIICLFASVVIFGITMNYTMTSCTENERAKSFGGTMHYDVPVNQKVINVTWKETELWVLTRPMRVDENAETFKFVEKSSFGILEGEIILKETKTQ